MKDDTVEKDEARRVAQHEATTSAVEQDVNEDIAEQAEHSGAAEAGKIETVAGDMRSAAIDDVAGQNRGISRARGVARLSQVADYVFAVIYGLLAIRLVLALIAASSSNGFVQFINAVTEPFYALFRGIVPSPAVAGGYTLVVPIVIAMVAYGLLHLAFNGLLRMMVHRKLAV